MRKTLNVTSDAGRESPGDLDTKPAFGTRKRTYPEKSVVGCGQLWVGDARFQQSRSTLFFFGSGLVVTDT